MILDLVRYPDPRLSQKCEPVERVTDEVRKTLHDMAYTMLVEDGVGLAAPQIGVMQRLAIVRDEDGTVYTLINPRIVRRSGITVKSVESCLSDPAEFASGRRKITVRRSATVSVETMTLEGTWTTMHAKGPQACIVQHEIDHLDGVTIFHRVPGISFEKNPEAASA